MTVSKSSLKRTARRFVHGKRRSPPGAPPGTLVADPAASASVVRLMGYGPDVIEERAITDFDEVRALGDHWPVTWINVDGLADMELIERLGEAFGLHRLALEDVVNVHQRPKVEEYEDHDFIVTRMVHGGQSPSTEQISMFLGDGFLLTFQQQPGDCFDPIRERIRKHRGHIRDQGADYLAYALMDAVTDGYFPVLEAYGERLEELEDSVMARAADHLIVDIHDMKRGLLTLRRAIWPMREMLNALLRDSSSRISDQTRPYLRDCYDHTIQLMDMIETYREIASGLVDIYLSSISVRMNEIMKVLTIIATIFMPLGFIASLYGMNFDRGISPWNMPELGWYWGYPYALLLMGSVAAGLLVYFRFKGWLGGRKPDRHLPPSTDA